MKIKKLLRPPQYTQYQLQKAFVDALSRPKLPVKKWRPKRKFSTGVRKAALRGRCTSLIKLLAQPLSRRVRSQKDKLHGLFRVPSTALKGVTTPWNIVNSLPKLRHIKHTKRCHISHLGPRQKTTIEHLIQKLLDIYKVNHPPHGETIETLIDGSIVHSKCCKDPTNDKTLGPICQLNNVEQRKFLIRMLQMSEAKVPPVPPKPNRGPKKLLHELQPGLKKLAQPRFKIDLTRKNPFKVSPAALEAVATSWIEDLAKPREPRPPAPVYDFRGNEILPPRKWDIESRRRVAASQRTLELSQPKRRKKKAMEDVKEDPFSVSKAALQAVCSDRLVKLAHPKKQG